MKHQGFSHLICDSSYRREPLSSCEHRLLLTKQPEGRISGKKPEGQTGAR